MVKQEGKVGDGGLGVRSEARGYRTFNTGTDFDGRSLNSGLKFSFSATENGKGGGATVIDVMGPPDQQRLNPDRSYDLLYKDTHKRRTLNAQLRRTKEALEKIKLREEIESEEGKK